MEEVSREDKKKGNTRSWLKKCIIVFYCGFLLLVFSMSLFRLAGLTAHLDWIQEHNNKFPSACGDWAE